MNKKFEPAILIQQLKDQGETFEIIVGNYSLDIHIIGEKEKIKFRENSLSKEALFLSGKIKREISLKNYGNESLKKERPKYYDFYHRKEGTFKSVSEVDINKAYWFFAHKLGYISEDSYLQGLELEKKERLIVLGSIATTKRKVQYFEGEKFAEYTIYDKSGKSAFYNISKAIGNTMSEAVNYLGPQYFYFFWVDAFFCSSAISESLVRFLDKKGIGCHTNEISSITIKKPTSEGSIFYYAIEKRREFSDLCNLRIKPFSYSPKEEQIKNYINILTKYGILK